MTRTVKAALLTMEEQVPRHVQERLSETLSLTDQGRDRTTYEMLGKDDH